MLRGCSKFSAGKRPAPLRPKGMGNPAPVPLVPVVQSSPRALAVPSARFTPHLRVALPFGQVSTGHPLPSGAPRILYPFPASGACGPLNPGLGIVGIKFQAPHSRTKALDQPERWRSQETPRTATVANVAKSLCPFFRRAKGHTVACTSIGVQPSITACPVSVCPAVEKNGQLKGILPE